MATVYVCQEDLDKKVSTANEKLRKALEALAHDLGDFGFEGNVTLKLRVDLTGEGQRGVKVERKTVMPFRR
jgi:hypothetical protein